jgi:hypothetical protein
MSKTQKTVPAEIKKFNWGAFLLPICWSIGNKVWVGMLLSPAWPIPAIVLGLKANEWAWQKNHYNSAEEFLKTQKKWLIAGIVINCWIPFIFLLFLFFYYLLLLFN